MTVLQQPDPLSLSGNIKDFQIGATEKISFVLKQGTTEVLSQSYTPGQNGIVTIDVRDIVHARLSFTLQELSSTYLQPNIASTFTAIIEGTSVTFRVIRAGVDRLADSATNFLTQNFLTWQPTLKAVTYHSPEFLTYYAVVAGNVKLKAYFTNDSGEVTSQQDITIASLFAGNAYTIPLQYAVVSAKLGGLFPAYYDVWIESTSGDRLTYIQRYYASNMLSEQEQWILFENSLGGIDTFRAYGSTDFSAEHTHNIAEIDEVSTEYRVDTTRKFQKNTGHLDKNQRRWLLDFFPSAAKYIYTSTYLRSIVVVESNVSYTDKELPSNYTFTYQYADARPLLNLPRVENLPSDLNIKIPELGSFSVPPRLVEFPRLPLSEGALFPVQNPYSEDWATTTASQIADFLAARLVENYEGGGGIGHKHNNIDLLQVFSCLDEYLLVAGKKIKAGYADKAGSVDGMNEIFLRKDAPDQTEHLIKFLAGAEFGEAIDSMTAGRGTIIDANGRIQADRMELRDSLTVQELIFNRLSAMEGDYSFSESGTVDSIENLGDNTYRLTLRKRWDFDFTAIDEHDVMYGVVNNLASGGGEFYTSWFRVLNKNATANSITVLLYPDSEVPGGKNYPPSELMIITRRGNVVNEDRQGYWYLSSRERCICMLDGVTKPVLEENNYSVIIGRLKNLSIFDNLPINYRHSYVFVRGIAIQDLLRITYQGTPIHSEVPRGLWSAVIAAGTEPYRYTDTEMHTVYHLGCKWQCVIDKTTEAPKWNATGWVMIEGNSELSMRFGSSAGDTFFSGRVSTTVTPCVYLGNNDISADILPADWAWTRNSGNVTEDNAWAIAHANNGRLLILSNEDMGSYWSVSRKTAFICTAYVRDSEGVTEIENRIIT